MFNELSKMIQGIELLDFFRTFVWLIFICLVVYVWLSWKYEKKVEDKRDVIRKTWYSIFLFGALIYWSFYPNSIFTGWKNYLIVAVIFALVDAFVFLGMYVLKIGNHELATATKQVEITDAMVVEYQEQVKTLTEILKEGLPGSYNNKEEYISSLKVVLEKYANREEMELEILPFVTDAEKEEVFNGLKHLNKALVKSKMERDETFYKEKLAFHPITLLFEPYVIKLSSKKVEISEINISIIGLLILTFDLAIKEI